MTSTNTAQGIELDEYAPGAWVIGHNLSGYLPEADTYAYADRTEAVEAFVAMAEEYADQDDEMIDEDNQVAYASEDEIPEDERAMMRAVVDSILADDGPNAPDLAGKDYGMRVEDGRGRTIYFWLQWEPTRVPFTDDLNNPLD
jgi:hypothetical protein